MPKHFTVEARSILTLGRDSIKSPATAVIELVKNSYDADATLVEIEIITKVAAPYIRIADNGHGMNADDIERKWLRIGFSEKLESEKKISKKGRRRTGEKGIGRISSDRLGQILKLVSKTEKSQPYGIRINWGRFEKTGIELHEVLIIEKENTPIQIPQIEKKSKSGTEIIIKGLRDKWDKLKLDALKHELSILIPPFKKVPNFLMTLKSDIDGFESGEISAEFYKEAVVSFDGIFNDETESVKFTTKVIGQNPQASIELISKLSRAGSKSLSCGSCDIVLYFFPKISDLYEAFSIDKKKLNSFINENQGIKIYRDNIRVKPYGDLREEEWDWVNLGKRYAQNPAGAARKGFRVRPQQIIGAVFISRDTNLELVDSSSREGIIKGQAFEDLKELVRICLRLLETEYNKYFVSNLEEKTNPRQLQIELDSMLENASSVLKYMIGVAPIIATSTLDTKVKEQFDMSVDKLSEAISSMRDTKKFVERIEDRNVVYRGLATVGIATAVFGHEIESHIKSLSTGLYQARDFLSISPYNLTKAKKNITKAINAAESVANWGKYALTRVEREKRRRKDIPIHDLVTRIIEELTPAFNNASIELRTFLKPVEGKVFPMDIEAILVNLLTNSYEACLDSKQSRVIKVRLKPKNDGHIKGFELTVSDTGPGISEAFREQIWEPMFTTKTEGSRASGTGLGLAIVDAAVKDSKGKRFWDTDPELKGAKFTIWLPRE